MQKENHSTKNKQVYITVAVFYTLKQAEKTFQELHLQRKLKGGKAAVIVEKDLRGDLHMQEFGPNAGKSAAKGAVLGAVLGIVTGGAGLALVALGGVLGGVKGKRAQDASFSADLSDPISGALAPGTSAILVAGNRVLPQSVLEELKANGAELINTVLSREEIEQMLNVQADAGDQELTESFAQKCCLQGSLPGSV